MSISSTGLSGSATIVNSDLFNDVETLKEQVTTLSTSYLDATREHREDISQNRQDVTVIEDDITDISSNKDFIRHLQSVDYSILLANALAQWPTPPIKSGYNGVFCTDSGVDIVTQNFLPLNIGTPSVLQIQSTDTSESTINKITKGINFTNAIDNTNQLIIDNEGVFIKEIYRDNAINTRDTGFKNLNDWMAAVEDMLITLGGFKESGYTFIDLISDIIGVVGLLASLGAFAAMKGYILSLGVAMKSMFLSTTVLNTIDDGVDLAKDFKNDFIEDAFANSSNAVIGSNVEEAFKNVTHDELIGFIWKNYARTHEVFNHKFYEINGVKTYFQSVGGLVDAAKVVPQNLFRTIFENRCGFKNNIYVPDIFFGAAFTANALNHDYFPGAYSLNDLKLNVDSINTNIGTMISLMKIKKKWKIEGRS